MEVTAGSPRRSASKLVCVCAARLFADSGSAGAVRISDDGTGGVARIVDDGSAVAEDRGALEDCTAPESGTFDLEQAASMPTATIKQPRDNIFDIFTGSILLPSSAAQSNSLLRWITGGRLINCCL